MKRGFTLIELITTMAIIVVLAGFIFAFLGPARENARVSVCKSNLRQISQALRMYVSDYDGVELSAEQATKSSEAGYPVGNAISIFLDQYIKTRSILFCPSYVSRYKNENLAITYTWHMTDELYLPAPMRFNQQVKLKGDSVIIMSCTEHNHDKNGDNLSDYENKKIIGLRANGEVFSSMVPARSMYPEWK